MRAILRDHYDGGRCTAGARRRRSASSSRSACTPTRSTTRPRRWSRRSPRGPAVRRPRRGCASGARASACSCPATSRARCRRRSAIGGRRARRRRARGGACGSSCRWSSATSRASRRACGRVWDELEDALAREATAAEAGGDSAPPRRARRACRGLLTGFMERRRATWLARVRGARPGDREGG